MKLSIIVPIYNVEKYISKSLESIKKYTPKDCEILLIDDGTTDESGKIAKEFESLDNRFKYYHKENGGLSDARNFGIKKATGDFVCFFDSDDLIDENFLLAIENMDTDADVNWYGYTAFYLKNTKKIELEDDCFSGGEIFKALEISTRKNSACTKIFKKSFITNNNLYFNSGFAEDFNMTGRMMLYAKKIHTHNLSYYLYVAEREGSIMNVYKKRRFFEIIDQARNLYLEMQQVKTNRKLKKRICQYIGFNILSNYRFVKFLNKDEREECFKYLEKNKYLVKTQKRFVLKMVVLFGRIFGFKNTFKFVK